MSWITWRRTGKFATFAAVFFILVALSAAIEQAFSFSIDVAVGWWLCLLFGALNK